MLTSQHIRDARKSYGITQRQMAKAMGITRESYILLESGRFTLTQEDYQGILETITAVSKEVARDTDPDEEEERQAA